VPLAVSFSASLLGLAAFIAAVGGVLSTVIGARRARRDERDKAEEECVQRLRATRAEAEQLAAELHAIRMRRELEE
jgi:hypothetical protein